MPQATATLLEFVSDQFNRIHMKLDRLSDGLNGLRSRPSPADGEAAHVRIELAEVNARLERISLRLDRLERPSGTFPGS